MIVKLVDQFPLHGKHCIFYMADGTKNDGHWEHGGAYEKMSIIFYDKAIANLSSEDFNKIISWEYKS